MADEYRVETEPVGNAVHVVIACGEFSQYGPGTYVRPANKMERLIGITHESKVRKAVRKAKRTVNKLNREHVAAEAVNAKVHV